MGERRNEDNVPYGISKEKRHLGRAGRRWEEHFQTDLRQGRWRGFEVD
jgi:hypothetical protein